MKITPTCAIDNEIKPDGYCRPKILRYKDKVYVVWSLTSLVDNVSPGMAKVQLAETSGFSYGGCRLKNIPEVNGRIKIACVSGSYPTFSWIFFYINPTTNRVIKAPDEEFSENAFAPVLYLSHPLNGDPNPASNLEKGELKVSTGKYIYSGYGDLAYYALGASDQDFVYLGGGEQIGQCNRYFCSYNDIRQIMAYSN